jgi:small subunit ribosomal protein S2
MSNELITELVEAGVHFGHQSRKWNPRMRNYILGEKHNVHIIDLEQTIEQLDTAGKYLSDLVAKGKKILFVGCKRQAQDAVREAAEATGQYYVNHRWLGGTLTNQETVRRSVGRMESLENLQKSPDFKKMSKKEIASLNREKEKLHLRLSGIRNMDRLPDAVVIVDSAREYNAINEARKLRIPIVAMVDSNADPDIVDYPIVANDDAIRSIRVVLKKLIEPVIGAAK